MSDVLSVFFTTVVSSSRSLFAARLLFALLKRTTSSTFFLFFSSSLFLVPLSLLFLTGTRRFATNLALLFKDDIMMLEADVTIAPNSTTPIMAHPPAISSDLTLEEFLSKVIANNASKGIKLDFKSIEAFNASKPILDKVRNNVRISSVVFIDRRVHLCGVLRASFHRSPSLNGIPELGGYFCLDYRWPRVSLDREFFTACCSLALLFFSNVLTD